MHCGNRVRLSDAVLQEQASARRFPPQTPLRLGMKANWEGKEWEAAGRQVMVERDDEGTYTWEEWVLIAPDGDLLYLEFDEGKWKYSRPFVPDQPLGPDQLQRLGPGATVPFDGGAMVTDAGRCQLAHAEGEFPYMVFPDRTKGYLDATRFTQFYSVEWDEDAVEFYKGRFLDERQVFSMFGMREQLSALDVRDRVLKARKTFGGLLLGLSLLSLVIWIYSLGSGKLVPNGSGTVELGQATGEGFRFGPIPLKAVNTVHRLEISGSMREESNWVQAIIEDENELELFSSERDMWDESGVDSDGSWHESDLHASTDFVLKKAGNYFVRIYAEPEPGRIPSPGTTATFRLKERAVYPTYLGVFGFSALVLGIGFLLAGSPSTIQKMKESASSDD